MIRTITAGLLLTALPADAEEVKTPPKITYLICTVRESTTPKEEPAKENAEDQAPTPAPAKAPEPYVTSYAFTETELFIDNNDLDKDSVKITPNAITWTENNGDWVGTISRVTGGMTWGHKRTASPSLLDCVVTDKTKF